MEIGFILGSGIILIGFIILIGNFINQNADKIFGESFVGIIFKHIGFIAANIDMIILIVLSITGFVVFSILNDVKVKNIKDNDNIEKHKIKFTESLTEGLDIFRGSGMKKHVETFEIERMFDGENYHTNCNEIDDEKKRSKCLLYDNKN